MEKRKSDNVNSESKKCRIMHERSLDDSITEMLVYENSDN
jgi:hypothetical protein